MLCYTAFVSILVILYTQFNIASGIIIPAISCRGLFTYDNTIMYTLFMFVLDLCTRFCLMTSVAQRVALEDIPGSIRGRTNLENDIFLIDSGLRILESGPM